MQEDEIVKKVVKVVKKILRWIVIIGFVILALFGIPCPPPVSKTPPPPEPIQVQKALVSSVSRETIQVQEVRAVEYALQEQEQAHESVPQEQASVPNKPPSQKKEPPVPTYHAQQQLELVSSGPPKPPNGTVTRVIDVNTIEVAGIGRIRLIGVDALEREQLGFNEATQFLKDLVEGKVVNPDINETRPVDRFGRTRAVVFVNGLNVNDELVRRGLARRV